MNGLCECGCGHQAPLAKANYRARGWKKGMPVRFILGHVAKRPPNEITSDSDGTWLLLAKGVRSRISESDIPLLRGRCWVVDSEGYVRGYKTRLHALLLGRKPKHHVDHINRDKLDNRRENLRLVRPVVNVRNHGRHRHNTSGHNGIRWVEAVHTVRGKTGLRWKDGEGRWLVYININRRQQFVGYYRSLDEAIQARGAAEQKYWLEAV